MRSRKIRTLSLVSERLNHRFGEHTYAFFTRQPPMPRGSAREWPARNNTSRECLHHVAEDRHGMEVGQQGSRTQPLLGHVEPSSRCRRQICSPFCSRTLHRMGADTRQDQGHHRTGEMEAAGERSQCAANSQIHSHPNPTCNLSAMQP